MVLIPIDGDYTEAEVRSAVSWSFSLDASFELERRVNNWVVRVNGLDESVVHERLNRSLNDARLRSLIEDRTEGLRARIIERALTNVFGLVRE